MSRKYTIVDIDYNLNIAFTEEGDILEIESYEDEDENPCLPEEAVAVNIKVGSTHYKRFEITGDENDFYQNY